MTSKTEADFVQQLKANQNIVHKICRLYTRDQDSHMDLFQEITIQLWKAYPSKETVPPENVKQELFAKLDIL